MPNDRRPAKRSSQAHGAIPRRSDSGVVDLGSEHDWSSHAADAFGLMAISYEEPSKTSNFNRVIEYQKTGIY